MRRRLFASVVALVLGFPALAACGSSAGGSASAGGQIDLGIITPVQSQATSLPWLSEAAQAAVDEVNAAGGVKGHQLHLNICNGQFDAGTELRCAQQSVASANVAMVGQLAADGAQIDPLFTSSKMANIGVNAIAAVDAQAQSSFVLDPGVLGYIAFAPTLKKELKVTKIAVLNSDTSAYETSVAVEKLGAAKAGVDIVKEIRVPDDATDMSLYVSQAAAAGAQALAINLLQTQVLSTWKALAAIHSPLKLVVDQTSVSNNLKAAGAAANGSYGITSTPQSLSSSTWMKAYNAAMAKYEPGKDGVSGGLYAYEAVYLFADAAKTIKGEITRDSVWKAMQGFSGQFAWFKDLDFTKAGPIAGYPRIAEIETYPVVVNNGAQQALAPFDPTRS